VVGARRNLSSVANFLVGPTAIREILWNTILAHGIHHRGQLSLMCRLAGGVVPALYGPNLEQTAALRAAAVRSASSD
jgi:uncharacterized damage-inducible protein DinB